MFIYNECIFCHFCNSYRALHWDLFLDHTVLMAGMMLHTTVPSLTSLSMNFHLVLYSDNKTISLVHNYRHHCHHSKQHLQYKFNVQTPSQAVNWLHVLQASPSITSNNTSDLPFMHSLYTLFVFKQKLQLYNKLHNATSIDLYPTLGSAL